MKLLPSVFILGTQRSGTTLLTRMLSSHPGFFVLNEGLRLPAYFSELSNSSGDRELAEGSVILDEFPRLRAALSSMSEKGAGRWGYKDPQLIEHLPTLRQLAANGSCRLIVIVRDPRGVVNSYMTHKWGLGANAYSGAQRWQTEVAQQLQLRDDYADATLIVRYEDLVSDAEAVLHGICSHIDLPFDKEMLAYHRKKADYRINDENVNTGQPPDAALASKWQGRLSRRQVEAIEYVTRDLMDKFDYERAYPLREIGSVSRLLYLLHQKTVGEAQMQLRWRGNQLRRLLGTHQ